MRVLATALLLLSTTYGCMHAPHTAYGFDPGPGSWELGGHEEGPNEQHEVYVHEVYDERLEVWEIHHPAPAGTSAEFSALAPAARIVPPLGTPTAPPRAIGDDAINDVQGYWIEQTGRADGDSLQAAAWVIPNGRRYFFVRMRSAEDDTEQLRAWLRDTILRNFRFPPPQR